MPCDIYRMESRVPSIMIDGVDVISVPRQDGPYRIIRFLRTIWLKTQQEKTIVFIKYFKLLSWIVRIIRPKNPMVLDIRTGSVAKNKLTRHFYDALMKTEALFLEISL